MTIMPDQYWQKDGASGLVVRVALRTLQFVFAVIVAALYGIDLHHSTTTNTHAPASWVFAEVVSALSIITCILHCFVTVRRQVAWCTWDWILFLLWIAQFGAFGAMFLGGKKSGDGSRTESVQRMKIAVWIDGINALLWFSTALGGVVWCCTARSVKRRVRVRVEEEARSSSGGSGELGVGGVGVSKEKSDEKF